MKRRWLTETTARVALLAVCMLLAACSQSPAPPSARSVGTPAEAGSAPVVVAAIGASETVGVGVKDRLRQSWPQLFYNLALPGSAVLYNFGIPGATTAEALDQETPDAIAVHPTLVTIWLNVNDLVAGVPPATYEAQLGQLVRAFRQAGPLAY